MSMTVRTTKFHDRDNAFGMLPATSQVLYMGTMVKLVRLKMP